MQEQLGSTSGEQVARVLVSQKRAWPRSAAARISQTPVVRYFARVGPVAAAVAAVFSTASMPVARELGCTQAHLLQSEDVAQGFVGIAEKPESVVVAYPERALHRAVQELSCRNDLGDQQDGPDLQQRAAERGR